MVTEAGRRTATPREVMGKRVASNHGASDDFTYVVIETPTAPNGDRRSDRRMRTRLRDGLVAERRGRPLVDCRIRDLSRTGARLQLDKDRPLPRRFLLTDTASRSQYWATLIWQAGRDAGVRLEAVAGN